LPGERIFTAAADVTQAASVEDLADAVLAHFGQIDVLLNTAGGWSGGKPVWETSVASINGARIPIYGAV
jgi:NAD(P)-dependent dehydrogenase (short-subunit alcohol dehydrogenase family)